MIKPTLGKNPRTNTAAFPRIDGLHLCIFFSVPFQSSSMRPKYSCKQLPMTIAFLSYDCQFLATMLMPVGCPVFNCLPLPLPVCILTLPPLVMYTGIYNAYYCQLLPHLLVSNAVCLRSRYLPSAYAGRRCLLSADCCLLLTDAVCYRPTAVCYWPSAVCYWLIAVCYWPTAVCYWPTAVFYWPTAVWYWPTACCLPLADAVCYWPTAVCDWPTAVCHWPTAVCYSPTAVCCWPTAVCHWPTGVCHWPTAVCYWPTAVCYWPICPRSPTAVCWKVVTYCIFCK